MCKCMNFCSLNLFSVVGGLGLGPEGVLGIVAHTVTSIYQTHLKEGYSYQVRTFYFMLTTL